MHYRRALIPGSTVFFTAALADRKSILLIGQADRLREVTRIVKLRHPFEIVGMVVLPDHLHAIWRLPPGDADYPTRWALIKAGFSRGIPKGERIRPGRTAKRERGIWQRRYWVHLKRDDQDLQTHVDYIHHNPVKHAYVAQASAWPHSSIHSHIRMGWMKADWGVGIEMGGAYGERGGRRWACQPNLRCLQVKGASSVVEVGTKVKNIRLVEGDHDIDCKVEGIGAMQLKSECVKKV